MFTRDVRSFHDFVPPTGFASVARNVPDEWIDDALAATGTRTLRRRKLPARLVVWLVIAMALFRDRSIAAVVAHLRLALDPDSPDGRGRVVPGAIPPARRRLGEAPMRALFEKTAAVWVDEATDRCRWHGLRVFAVDGSTIRLPDTPENEAELGRPSSRNGKSGYPQARLVALNEPSSHLLAGLAIGPYTTNEQVLAIELWPRIPERSVTILDRGFLAHGRLYELAHGGDERHWLIKAKSNTRTTLCERLAEGDQLVWLGISRDARKANPDLPDRYLVRAIRVDLPGFRPYTLLTSLTDAAAFTAHEIAELYRERWEIELGLAEKKTRLLENKEHIRSKTPQGVRQELWGIAIAYNLVRLMMLRVASKRGLPPRRLSFWNALLTIRNFAVMSWVDAPGSLPRLLDALQRDIGLLVLTERRDRSYPRHVKIKMSNYPRNTGDPGGEPHRTHSSRRDTTAGRPK